MGHISIGVFIGVKTSYMPKELYMSRIYCTNPAIFYFINYDIDELDWLYIQYKELEYWSYS